MHGLSTVVRRVIEQLDVIVERDPSIHSRGQAALHPTVPAIFAYRIAHRYHRRGRCRTALALCVWARFLTGVEIHPGARIGDRFFIDHGSGVVIGETAIVGDDVTLYHHVTLGAVGWWKDHARDPGQRRHPRLGNGVTVGAAAMLLGPISVGDNARVGAQALLVCDVPAGALVLAPKATIHETPGRAA